MPLQGIASYNHGTLIIIIIVIIIILIVKEAMIIAVMNAI